MSDDVKDSEAKLLLGKLAHRSSLLALADADPRRRALTDVVAYILVAAFIAIASGFVVRGSETFWAAIALVGVVSSWMYLVLDRDRRTNVRVDALVELLRQEGLLQGTLPAADRPDQS
jgi:hypothetical protein